MHSIYTITFFITFRLQDFSNEPACSNIVVINKNTLKVTFNNYNVLESRGKV